MAEQDYKDTVTKEMLKSLLNEGMKSIYIRDAQGLIVTSYEAPIKAKANDPCLITTIVYDSTTQLPIAQEEIVGAWPTYTILSATDGDDITTIP